MLREVAETVQAPETLEAYAVLVYHVGGSHEPPHRGLSSSLPHSFEPKTVQLSSVTKFAKTGLPANLIEGDGSNGHMLPPTGDKYASSALTQSKESEIPLTTTTTSTGEVDFEHYCRHRSIETPI